MKKICIFMSLVVLCTLLFTACDKTDSDTTKNSETTAVSSSAEQTTLSAEDIALQEKEAGYAKKCIETLILSKNADEIKKVTKDATDEYIQEVIEGFPYDDYAVTVKKVGEYKERIIYYVEVERAADGEGEEYYFDGIQIFARTQDGLLIDLDVELENEITEKFYCRSCSGSGITGVDEVHGLQYKCDVCHGMGFVF